MQHNIQVKKHSKNNVNPVYNRSIRSTATEEKRAWRRRVEELEASIQPAVFIQVVEEGGSGLYAGFL